MRPDDIMEAVARFEAMQQFGSSNSCGFYELHADLREKISPIGAIALSAATLATTNLQDGGIDNELKRWFAIVLAGLAIKPEVPIAMPIDAFFVGRRLVHGLGVNDMPQDFQEVVGNFKEFAITAAAAALATKSLESLPLQEVVNVVADSFGIPNADVAIRAGLAVGVITGLCIMVGGTIEGVDLFRQSGAMASARGYARLVAEQISSAIEAQANRLAAGAAHLIAPSDRVAVAGDDLETNLSPPLTTVFAAGSPIDASPIQNNDALGNANGVRK